MKRSPPASASRSCSSCSSSAATSCGRASARTRPATSVRCCSRSSATRRACRRAARSWSPACRRARSPSSTVDGRYAQRHVQASATTSRCGRARSSIKKATSLLGENYLEIDPGEDDAPGARRHAQTFTRLGRRARTTTRRCRSATPAAGPNVVEATTPDQLLHRDRADAAERRSRARERARSVRGRAPRRQRPAGRRSRSASMAWSSAKPATVAGHHRARRSLDRADRADHERHARASRSDADPQINDDPRQPRRSVGRGEGPGRDREVRARSRPATRCASKLDKLDGVIANTDSITKKIDEDKGTLGRLVNDPAIADNVEQITDDAQGLPRHAVQPARPTSGCAASTTSTRAGRAQLRLGRAPHAARQVLPDRAREGPARRLPRRHADVRSDRRSEPLDPQRA